jgi:putative NADH-flavin reductase
MKHQRQWRKSMKFTVFAATGGIGSQIVEQALGAGHKVTAVVRDPQRLAERWDGIRLLSSDLTAPESTTLMSAVAGAEAVLSGLGARSMAEVGVASQGTRAIAHAMQSTDVRRILVVSAAPVSTFPSSGRPNPPRHDPGDGFFMRNIFGPLISNVLRKVYEDLALMEDVLRDSNRDKTIFRPPRLTDRPLTGNYRMALGKNLRGGLFISRADVAHAMLRALAPTATIKQTIGIAY